MIKFLKIKNPKKGFVGKVHIKVNPPDKTYLVFHRKGFYYVFESPIIQVFLKEDKEMLEFKKEFPKEYESCCLQRSVREMLTKTTQIVISKSFLGIPYHIVKVTDVKLFNKIQKSFINLLADPTTNSEI